MNDRPIEDNEMPAEIDFSKGVRGLHRIPAGAKVFLPVSFERSVWEYFSGKLGNGELCIAGCPKFR